MRRAGGGRDRLVDLKQKRVESSSVHHRTYLLNACHHIFLLKRASKSAYHLLVFKVVALVAGRPSADSDESGAEGREQMGGGGGRYQRAAEVVAAGLQQKLRQPRALLDPGGLDVVDRA